MENKKFKVMQNHAETTCRKTNVICNIPVLLDFKHLSNSLNMGIICPEIKLFYKIKLYKVFLS